MPKATRPTQAMFAAIGRVAAECAEVEDQLRELFSHLIGTKYGGVITAGEDISKLTQLCLRVARYNHDLTEGQVRELAELMKSVERLRPHRNFLIHAVWVKSANSEHHIGMRSSRASSRADAQGTRDGAFWTPAQANEVADAFGVLADEVRSYVDRTFQEAVYEELIERTAWARFSAFLEGSSPGSPW